MSAIISAAVIVEATVVGCTENSSRLFLLTARRVQDSSTKNSHLAFDVTFGLIASPFFQWSDEFTCGTESRSKSDCVAVRFTLVFY